MEDILREWINRKRGARKDGEKAKEEKMEREAIGEKKELMKVQGENGAWKELGGKKSKWTLARG